MLYTSDWTAYSNMDLVEVGEFAELRDLEWETNLPFCFCVRLEDQPLPHVDGYPMSRALALALRDRNLDADAYL